MSLENTKYFIKPHKEKEDSGGIKNWRRWKPQKKSEGRFQKFRIIQFVV